MHAEWEEAGQCDARFIERACAGGAREPEEFPRADGTHDGQQRGKGSAARQHNPERERCGDDRDYDTKREFAHTSMISASLALII